MTEYVKLPNGQYWPVVTPQTTQQDIINHINEQMGIPVNRPKSIQQDINNLKNRQMRNSIITTTDSVSMQPFQTKLDQWQFKSVTNEIRFAANNGKKSIRYIPGLTEVVIYQLRNMGYIVYKHKRRGHVVRWFNTTKLILIASALITGLLTLILL